MSDDELKAQFGRFGDRLAMFVRGLDDRPVSTGRATKSISAETTFRDDLSAFGALAETLDPLIDRVCQRVAEKGYAGQTVVLKLKTSSFQLLTRNLRLATPTQKAEVVRAAAHRLLNREADGRSFRLIGIGLADMDSPSVADPPDLFSDLDT